MQSVFIRPALVAGIRQRLELESEQRPPMSESAVVSSSTRSVLKLHLRLLVIGATTYRLITLRPTTRIVFSTNFYHETWHIVTSRLGTLLLARLLWGLSYDRHPGTVVVVHGKHLAPTPFEAERSDPFLLTRAEHTRLDPTALRALKSALGRPGPPMKTVRWLTFGMDAALRGLDRQIRRETEMLNRNRPIWRQETMRHLGGLICYSAPAPVLRHQALCVNYLQVPRRHLSWDTDTCYLAHPPGSTSWYGDGEVQIFGDYVDRVAAATQARRELLRNTHQAVLSETLQEQISGRRDHIKARRAANKKRR